MSHRILAAALASLCIAGPAAAIEFRTGFAEALDPDFDPFYALELAASDPGFAEFSDGSATDFGFDLEYRLVNNAAATQLFGFGVTNPAAGALFAAQFGDSPPPGATVQYSVAVSFDGGEAVNGWDALILTAANWSDASLLRDLDGNATSAEALYGDAASVLGEDGAASYFLANDSDEFLPGSLGANFFAFGDPASSLFGLAQGAGGEAVIFTGAGAVGEAPAVPAPAAAPLLLGALGGFAALRRRRR